MVKEKIYKIEDFQIGMLIEAIIDSDIYKITGGEAYEIVDVCAMNCGPKINFINDIGSNQTKIINARGYPFDKYFKIL